jgi:hypothetical protein
MSDATLKKSNKWMYIRLLVFAVVILGAFGGYAYYQFNQELGVIKQERAEDRESEWAPMETDSPPRQQP